MSRSAQPLRSKFKPKSPSAPQTTQRVNEHAGVGFTRAGRNKCHRATTNPVNHTTSTDIVNDTKLRGILNSLVDCFLQPRAEHQNTQLR